MPDVLLLDIEMPGMDGIEVADRLAGADVKILIVTTFGRPGYLRRAMDAGAAGFVVKDTPASELAQAVRKVHQGGRVIDPSLAAESLLEGYNPLTERERGGASLGGRWSRCTCPGGFAPPQSIPKTPIAQPTIRTQ